MWLNQDSLARSLTHATSTSEVRIHIYPLISISRTIQKYSTPNPGENSQKYFYFPYEINAQLILVTTTCYIISWDECSKKRKKVRQGVKMDKCPTVELGVQNTHLRGKKKKSISFSSKVSKSKKGMYPLKRAKVELDFHHCYHHHHHTPFATHAHLDLNYWLISLDPWFDYTINVLWVCILYLPPMSSRY